MHEQGRHVSRRSFLRLGAVGATAAAAGCALHDSKEPPPTKPVARAEPAPPPAPYGRYQMGVQSYCFRNFSYDDAIAKAAELGLHYIEAFPGHFPQNSPPERVAAVEKLLAAKQVAMTAYGVCGIGSNEAATRKLLEFCKKVGIGTISAAPDPKAFGMLDKLVAEYDIKIAIHNHGPGDRRWGRLAKLLDGLKGHHANLGVCLDTGHLARAGDDSVAAVRQLGPRVHALHLKDWNAQKHDCVIGKGQLDLVAFFTALKETDFDGVCSIEYESDPANPMPGIAASLAAVRAAIAKVG